MVAFSRAVFTVINSPGSSYEVPKKSMETEGTPLLTPPGNHDRVSLGIVLGILD